jgi:hypothetical protein
MSDQSTREERSGEPVVQSALQQLMYGLIYPAVLGTGITMTGVRAAHHHSFHDAILDPTVELGIIAGCFFCASFDAVFYCPKGRTYKYTRLAFLLDCVEVVLMFVCFHFLRLFEDPNQLQTPNLLIAYLMLAIDVVLQFGWRAFVGLEVLYLWWLRLGVAIVLIVGCIWGQMYWWVNSMATVAVGLAVIGYVLKDPRYKKQQRRESL